MAVPKVDPRDQVPQGDPETVVMLPAGGALVGLYIKGVKGPAMLGIREDAEGQLVSCAIGIVLDVTSSQRNPNRHDDSDYTKGAVEP